jgi:hypothetical protein
MLATVLFRIFYLLVSTVRTEKLNIQNYNIPLILYGCITFSPTLNEEQTEGVWEQGEKENIWT